MYHMRTETQVKSFHLEITDFWVHLAIFQMTLIALQMLENCTAFSFLIITDIHSSENIRLLSKSIFVKKKKKFHWVVIEPITCILS